jgi:hypothetical protein
LTLDWKMFETITTSNGKSLINLHVKILTKQITKEQKLFSIFHFSILKVFKLLFSFLFSLQNAILTIWYLPANYPCRVLYQCTKERKMKISSKWSSIISSATVNWNEVEKNSVNFLLRSFPNVQRSVVFTNKKCQVFFIPSQLVVT